MRFLPFVFTGILGASSLLAQEVADIDRTTQGELNSIKALLSESMKNENATEIHQHFQSAVALLGDQAGLPEAPDQYRSVLESAHPFKNSELAKSCDPLVPFIERRKWWRVGLDPTKTNHSLREIASVVEGCVAAQRLNNSTSEKLLAIAKDAGDFLIWAQQQAETGVLPFPAMRKGEGRPFEVAESFFHRAEQNGTLDQVIRNGWTIEDFDDGGLQFDNGLAGVALVHLYEVTKEEHYKQAAIKSADWALSRRMVTNWNYNSFSVFLLAEAFRITGEQKYLESAKKKALLGVLPGQLLEGPRVGRWADPHNARPPYHYIMIRGLAALAAVMPIDDSDLPRITECIRMALLARNRDFQKGIFNADSAVEALLLVKSLPVHVQDKLADCQTDEAMLTLERYAADQFRRGKPVLGPGAWGQLVAFKKLEATRNP